MAAAKKRATDVLVGLDISQENTGWAVGDEKSPGPLTGAWHLPQGEHNIWRATAALRLSIASLIKAHKITSFWVEAAWMRVDDKHSAYVAKLAFSLQAVAFEAAWANGVRDLHEVAAPTWRKTFIGHGFPENPKQAARDKCDHFGWTYGSEDEAEACGVWFHGMIQTDKHWYPKRVLAA